MYQEKRGGKLFSALLGGYTGVWTNDDVIAGLLRSDLRGQHLVEVNYASGIRFFGNYVLSLRLLRPEGFLLRGFWLKQRCGTPFLSLVNWYPWCPLITIHRLDCSLARV